MPTGQMHSLHRTLLGQTGYMLLRNRTAREANNVDRRNKAARVLIGTNPNASDRSKTLHPAFRPFVFSETSFD